MCVCVLWVKQVKVGIGWRERRHCDPRSRSIGQTMSTKWWEPSDPCRKTDASLIWGMPDTRHGKGVLHYQLKHPSNWGPRPRGQLFTFCVPWTIFFNVNYITHLCITFVTLFWLHTFKWFQKLNRNVGIHLHSIGEKCLVWWRVK